MRTCPKHPNKQKWCHVLKWFIWQLYLYHIPLQKLTIYLIICHGLQSWIIMTCHVPSFHNNCLEDLSESEGMMMSPKENPERMRILLFYFPYNLPFVMWLASQGMENADKLSLPAQPVSSTSPRHVGNSFLARIQGPKKFMTASVMILTRKTETKKRISICRVCIDTLDT